MNRRIFIYASAILAALIVLGSIGPYDLKTVLLMHSNHPVSVIGLKMTPHRLVHFLAFGTLSLCSCIAPNQRYLRVALAGTVIMFGLAVETAEFLLSTNPFESWDLRDDAIASLGGYAAAEALHALLNARPISH